jgi:hypothetical protein
MSSQPLAVTLSDGQKIEALKRFRDEYQEALNGIETELTDLLTKLAEADFLASYIGEQAEVQKLRERKGEVETLERRRQHLLKIIDRLNQVIPPQPEAKFPLGGGKTAPAAPSGGLRRF